MLKFSFLHVFKHRHTPSRIIGLISQIRTQTKYIQSIVRLDGMAYFSQKSPFHRIAIGQQNIIYADYPSPHIPNIKQSHATMRTHQDNSTRQKYKVYTPQYRFLWKNNASKRIYLGFQRLCSIWLEACRKKSIREQIHRRAYHHEAIPKHST